MHAHFIHLKDPFRPTINREVGALVPGHRLSHILQRKGFIQDGKRVGAFIVLINGKPVLQRQWHRRIRENEVMTVQRLPRGGSGSNPLQIVAMLALVVASYYAGPAAASFFGGAGYGYAASAAIMITGSMLLNMVFKAKTNAISAASNAQASPTYSLSAQGNTARLLSPIPVIYGRMNMYPDYAATSYTEILGNDQYLYQLFCISQGYVDIESINIGDTPIGNYPEVEYELVQPNQPVTLFPTNVDSSSDVSGQVLYGPNNADFAILGPFVSAPSGTTTNYIGVDLTLPSGAFKVNNLTGAYENQSISFLVEYQEVDDSGAALGDWADLVSETVVFATATAQRLGYKVAVPDGRYQVRARRVSNDANGDTTISDTLEWTGLRAYMTSPDNYGNITLLAVKMKATNTLSTSSTTTINVTCTRKLNTWDPVNGWTVTPSATRNPAWAMADIIKEPNYGRNLPDSRYNLQKIYELAQTLDARGDTFNYVFDTTVQLWDALTTVGSACRTVPMYYAGLIDFIRNEPQSLPTAMFGPQNMVQNSFSTTYQFADVDTPDYVTISFTNEETWATDTVDCVLPGGTQNVQTTVTLDGVTTREQAWREGITMAAKNAYQRRLISFSTEYEGLLPAYGDLIQVSHDVPQWGYSGRVLSLDVNTGLLTLSEPCPFDDPTSAYVIAFRRRDGSADGPYTVTKPADGGTTELILAGTPESRAAIYISDGIRDEFTFYQFGPTTRAGLLCMMMTATPSNDGTVDITACNYAEQVYEAETGGTLPPSNPVSNLPGVTYLPIIDSVSLQYTYNVNQQTIVASKTNGAQYYEFQASPDAGQTWISYGTSADPQMTVSLSAGNWYIRVRAVAANVGPWNTIVVDVVATTLPLISIATFTATPLVFGVELSWTITQNTGGITDHVEIWHGLSSAIGNAVLLGTFATTSSSFAQMNMGPGETHYYWIRAVDSAGRDGPWFNSGTATVGQSSSDTTAILAQLANSITESQLSEALLTKIDSGGDAQVQIEAITNELAAMYTIKTQLTSGGRTYIAGIGVGVENDNGIIETQVLVAAQRFAIVDNTSTTVSVPFVVTGGVTYIASAFIQNASITNAKIVNSLSSTAVNSDGQPLWSITMNGGFTFYGTGSAASTKLQIINNSIILYSGNVAVVEISTALSGT